MKHRLSRYSFLIIGVCFSLAPIAVKAQEQDLSQIVKEELDREFAVLNALTPSAYYLAYRIDETQSWSVQGAFGSIMTDEQNHNRYVTTMLRVGDRFFDNTHTFKGDGAGMMFSASMLPLDNKKTAIAQELWKETDKVYKQAKADYLAKKNKIQKEDTTGVADFTAEKPHTYFEPKLSIHFSASDIETWKETVRKCSKEFLKDTDIVNGDVSFEYVVNRKHFISSEGSNIAQNLPYARIMISGLIKSPEGNQMPAYKSFYAESPAKLPNPDSLIKETQTLVKKLIEIKTAALAEPFTGPAILSPQASGVFFHEIFGHRVEGHRLKDETDGQTFKKKIGERVLPKSINVVFDPTQNYLNNTYLIGHYAFDDQGIPSQKVDVISNGVLNQFLTSRIPLNKNATSNGHGRASIGSSAVARQSNMFISSTDPQTEEELRKLLIKECKKQKVPYGYYFKEVTGGFTQTGRYMPNAFNVIPTEVYRVFADGTPDELVRGVDLIGTPLSMFSEIKAVGEKSAVFTGFCGAESGWVPVSAASPSIFVRKIETQRKSQSFSDGTLLPAPSADKLNVN